MDSLKSIAIIRVGLLSNEAKAETYFPDLLSPWIEFSVQWDQR